MTHHFERPAITIEENHISVKAFWEQSQSPENSIDVACWQNVLEPFFQILPVRILWICLLCNVSWHDSLPRVGYTANAFSFFVYFSFFPSFLFVFQVPQRPSLLGNCQALFYSTLPPSSGNIQLLHPLDNNSQYVAWLTPVCDFTITPYKLNELDYLCTRYIA